MTKLALSTLSKPEKVTFYSTSDKPTLSSKDNSANETGQAVKIVFVPSPRQLTPLDVYEAQLRSAGYSEELIKDIIEGLQDSPLYDGKAS